MKARPGSALPLKSSSIFSYTFLFAVILVFSLINCGCLSGADRFSQFRKAKSSLPVRSPEISLIAVGDVMLARGVASAMDKHGRDFPFAGIKEQLKDADIVFGNLESPITNARPKYSSRMIFCAAPGLEQDLKKANFSVLSLANNHIANVGSRGVTDTIKYLAQSGIAYVGAGADDQEAYRPVYLENNGIKLAFLAYADQVPCPLSHEAKPGRAGIAFMDKVGMTAAIKEAKQKADLVIISLHAGDEYVARPNPAQVDFAQAAIDSGADLVIGHHPHVVQTMEKYKDKYIFYSLGNFIFDQMWSEPIREGLLSKFILGKDGVHRIDFIPVRIEDFSQPQPAEGKIAKDILKRLDYSLSDSPYVAWDKKENTFKLESRKIIQESPVRDDLGSTSDFRLSKKEMADLDKDGQPETYILDNGLISVQENSRLLWRSPTDWWVDDFSLADSNNDDIVNLNLSVWKAGRFGSSRPFWIKADQDIKNHFFIFDLVRNRLKPVWQSSSLDAPNLQFRIYDIDGDGKNELVVVEGAYDQFEGVHGQPDNSRQYLTVWRWQNWGFVNLWRSQPGHYIIAP